jgi:heparan-alpha-glucosaminide N-acetyltransferase
MKKLFNHLWIFYITIQLILHYGQTEIIENISQDDLGMDEGYLTITNKNYPDPILVTFNLVVCEHCAFQKLADTLLINISQTVKIDTNYPHDFQIFAETTNKTLVCQIESYKFSEHGSYSLDILQISSNESSCTIDLTKEPSDYWVPVICAILFLCCFVLIIQLIHHIYHSRYIGRILTNIGHERLINNEAEIPSTPSPRREPSLIANEIQNEDLSEIGTANELPLVGSTRLNNSIRITKVLPKRLRSLDTFRGFALMIMIFVNYGGKNLLLIYFLFKIFIYF